MGLKLIGIGDDGIQSLLPMYETWIQESEVLVGGKTPTCVFFRITQEKRL
ncbi:hypothetical protein GCM10020331_062460 [Ectobacillus funiculus]